MSARRTRIPARTLDTAIGLLVFVEAVVESLFVADEFHAGALPIAATIAVGAALHRRAAFIGMVLALAGLVSISLLPKETVEGLGGPFLAVIFTVYSMALRNEGRRLWLGGALAFAAGTIATLTDQFDDGAQNVLVVGGLIVAAPVAAGQLLRSRMALASALRERAQRAERERERRAEEAVAAERTRIAGELHDVIAHALGAMTVQATAARRLSTRDAERAGAAFHAIEGTGREALAELRRLLGVLRRDDEELALAPQPRLSHLRDLARRASAAGLPVDLEVDGEPGELPAGVDLVAYRVVQEALTEARRSGHAGRAAVLVRYGTADVVVEITDDGRSGGERSLLGMRERVRVYGGDVEIGALAGGGHRVRARLPLEAPA